MNRLIWILLVVGLSAIVVGSIRVHGGNLDEIAIAESAQGPFSAKHAVKPTTTSAVVWPFVQLWATTNMAIVLLYGPGFVWFTWQQRPAGDLAFAALLGPLLLSAVGLACWLLGGLVSPVAIARIAILAMFGVLGVFSWRNGRHRIALSKEIVSVLGIGMLLVGFGVAKANLSYAAPGELFHGTVSRTLEVGGHSDSRIPYHTVQIVAHHLRPFAPETHDYFYPWSFSSRGPLAGLLAAPIVLATGADVPLSMPAEVWHPFDPQGFAAYRIVMIVLASLAGWAIYGVAYEVAGGSWAYLATSIAFLAPFYVHEMYFTWPKLIAAAGVLGAFLLTMRMRPFAAGIALGIAYLFHPSAILAAPFLAICILGDSSCPRWKARAFQAASYAIGLILVVGAWQSIRFLDPAKQTGQEGFVEYFFLADNHTATWSTWFRSRWDNLANTFIPFRLLFTDQTHESINSYYGPSDAWVHFGFLYWNTLPFALGLPAFLILTPALLVGIWRRTTAAFTFVIGPTAFLVIYWGCASTGLMRHTGQWLFLSIILFSVLSLRQVEGRLRFWTVFIMTQPVLLILRGLDVGWMAFGTTLHDHFPNPSSPFFLNDWITLGLASAFLISGVFLLARKLQSIRKDLLSANGLPSTSGQYQRPAAWPKTR